MMVNATVRLYRLNPATRQMDAADNGSMLGCIIMGAGFNYQLLIYNAQVKQI
jgi:hypothetical protein